MGVEQNARRDFLGSGLAFPVQVDQRGGIKVAGQVEAIDRSILLILMTRKGERKMRPTFGCEIHDLVFAPLDANTFGRAAYYVRDALEMWEPRIRVESVQAIPDAAQPGCMLIYIQYLVVNTNDKRNLVFPFYTIPQE